MRANVWTSKVLSTLCESRDFKSFRSKSVWFISIFTTLWSNECRDDDDDGDDETEDDHEHDSDHDYDNDVDHDEDEGNDDHDDDEDDDAKDEIDWNW